VEDLLFTEHNLDTKEDQKQESFRHSHLINDLFRKNSEEQKFMKFEGLIVKKPATANPFSVDDDKNRSEKSRIYAPFNSWFGDSEEETPLFDWPEEVTGLLEPKRSKIIKYSKKCRDLNRQYENNNNAEADNGVYIDFVTE